MGWPRGKKRSAECRAKMAEAARRRGADPAYRARQAEQQRQRMADPAFKARATVGLRPHRKQVPDDLRAQYIKVRDILGLAAARALLETAP